MAGFSSESFLDSHLKLSYQRQLIIYSRKIYLLVVLIKYYSCLWLNILRYENDLQTLQLIQMGQPFSSDPFNQLITKPPQLNTHSALTYYPLAICPALKVPFHSIISKTTSEQTIQVIVKFFSNRYVCLKLTRIPATDASRGVYFHSVGDYVYGYKNKISDKVRKDLIMYKKRIYGQQTQAIRRFAQIKLMSLLEVGPQLGRMINDSDAYISNHYIEFYTEVALQINTSPQKFKDKVIEVIQAKKLKVDRDLIHQLTFSPNQKCHIVKQKKYPAPGQMVEESSLTLHNNSSNYLRKQLVLQSQKTMQNLDKKTNMLSNIENCLIQKNIEKAIEIFEYNASNMEDNTQKMKYIERFCNIISASIYFKEYEEQVLVQALTTSCLLKQYAYTNPQNKRLEERLNKLRMGSTDFGSQNELTQFSHTYDMDERSYYTMKKQQLKINVFSNNKRRIRELIKEMKEEKGQKMQRQTYNYEIQYEFALLLMKSAKSRHSLIVFEMLVRNQEVPESLKCQIYNWMGIIYYHKDHFSLAIREFENQLNQLIKSRSYSMSMMLAYNNIGCSLYKTQQIFLSLQYFRRALNCGDYSADYEMMVRNNRAMAFIEKGQLKQARNQFIMIMKALQPINSASILCKSYTNLGYLDMLEKDFAQAMIDLQFACKIQSSCLIPNGYKPSVFLHNNIAMLHYKRKEFRKALAHFEKCRDQIETIKNIEAVFFHFNFAMTYRQLYCHEFALKHFGQSRRLLQRLGEEQIFLYEKKIESQIQKLNNMRIIEDSEESSYGPRQSFSSKYSNNPKNI